MSIDTQNETVVSFSEATKIVPGRPHLSQLYRWSQKGLHGCKLEWLQVGGKRFTSREALARFFAALTKARGGDPGPAPTPRARTKQIKAAEAELQEAGFEVGGE